MWFEFEKKKNHTVQRDVLTYLREFPMNTLHLRAKHTGRILINAGAD